MGPFYGAERPGGTRFTEPSRRRACLAGRVKISVYLPDDFAARVREAKLPVSAICQAALDDALRSLEAVEPFVDPDGALPGDMAVDGQVVRHFAAAAHLAFEHATARGSATVETEDLLRGVLEEGESLVIRTLDAIGVDPARLRAELDAVEGERAALADGATPQLSRRARRVVDQAVAEAGRRGQPLNLAHLLLALLDDGGGGASRALRAVGLDTATARRTAAAMESGLLFGRTAVDSTGPARIERLLREVLTRLDRIEAGATEVT